MDPANNTSSAEQALNVPFFRMRRKPMNTTTIRKRREEDENEEEKRRERKRAEEEDEEEAMEEEGKGEKQRQRGEESDGSGTSTEDDEGAKAAAEATRMKLVERRKHLRGRNLMHTTSKKRRREIEALAEEESSEDESDEESGGKGQTSFDPDVKFASSGTQRTGPSDMGATARSEVDTEYGRDSQSQFERIQEMLKKERMEREKREAEEEEDRKKYGEKAKRKEHPGTSQQPKVYRGMALYGAKEHEDTIKGNAASGLNRLGPIRAQQYMRASVRWDYAPDICKDYKETGFCTFGDSCKFMHDRTDYKHGWEIERDWEAGKLKEAEADQYLISSGDEGAEEDDKLPHSCFICREHFRQPVVTKCKHYFCEECALKHYQRSKKCAVCGQKTDGVFNVAREILAKMRARDATKAKKGDENELDDQNDAGAEEVEAKTLPMAEEAGETIEENESEESSEE
ncbi:hypothetical protein niasHT_019185 [Heterodera trifolii]|uniref:Zinc finger protein n=2 Tax=Heterodera trifolii TaxID=157864 RepID=A0ABD2L0R4_9BILA